MLSRTPSRGGYQRSLVLLNRVVLAGSVVYVLGWLFFTFTGGSAERLRELPDALDRLKRPLLWEVPEDGVRCTSFFHAPADEGCKFVIVRVRMQARTKIGFPIVPKCFELVDDQQVHYHPLTHSPIFIDNTDARRLDRGEVYEGDLVFQIPSERKSSNLLFERYQE